MNKNIKLRLNLSRRESFTGMLFCLPSTIGMLLFFVIPFGVCVYMSFAENLNLSKVVGIQNYIDVLSSAAFRLAAWNTLKFNLVAVPLIMVGSLAVAMLLYRKLKGYRAIISLGANKYFVYVVKERQGLFGLEYYSKFVEVQIIDQNSTYAAIGGWVITTYDDVVLSSSTYLTAGETLKVINK